MSEGLVCLLMKSAGETAKPVGFGNQPTSPGDNKAAGPGAVQAPAPLTYDKLPKEYQSQFKPLEQHNPWLHSVVKGSTFEPGEGGKYKFTPSKDTLGQIGTDENLQQALYQYNKDQSIQPLWEYGLKQTPGKGMPYQQSQFLQYQQGQVVPQLQKMLPKGMDVNDPNVQKQLENYTNLESEAEKNIGGQLSGLDPFRVGKISDIKIPSISVPGILPGIPITTPSVGGGMDFNRKIEAAEQAAPLITVERGYTPEAAQAAQNTLQKLQAFKQMHQQARPDLSLEEYANQLKTTGGSASELQAAAGDPARARQYMQEQLKNQDVAKAFEQVKKQKMNIPLEASPAVSDAIPTLNKVKMWAGDNPGTAIGLGVGGVGILSLLLSSLFSGGQKQAPQVAYQQRMPLPPQQPASIGRSYSINNLMG